jgi:hypothetical protein
VNTVVGGEVCGVVGAGNGSVTAGLGAGGAGAGTGPATGPGGGGVDCVAAGVGADTGFGPPAPGAVVRALETGVPAPATVVAVVAIVGRVVVVVGRRVVVVERAGRTPGRVEGRGAAATGAGAGAGAGAAAAGSWAPSAPTIARNEDALRPAASIRLEPAAWRRRCTSSGLRRCMRPPVGVPSSASDECIGRSGPGA